MPTNLWVAAREHIAMDIRFCTDQSFGLENEHLGENISSIPARFWRS